MVLLRNILAAEQGRSVEDFIVATHDDGIDGDNDSDDDRVLMKVLTYPASLYFLLSVSYNAVILGHLASVHFL